MSKSAVSVKFRWGLSQSDPDETPVLIVGQASHLASLAWQDIRCKLEPRVSEQIWERAVSSVTSSPGDACELYPKGAYLSSLPEKRARHAPPSRCHALAKSVKSIQIKGDEYIVLVCSKRDLYACALSIAQSFPLYNAKTGGNQLGKAEEVCPRTVTVEVHLVKESKSDGDALEEGLPLLDPYLQQAVLSEEDLHIVQAAADATRLAARIADTPANIMTVDAFIEEAITISKQLNICPPIVIRGEELRQRGMGGIYGVGRGAHHPPALVVLSTGGEGGVAWVGKGIVFDTGGLCIKTRTGMTGMKGDCAGAAATLAAFSTAVRACPTVPLHAVLCLAENSVGPLATRPDDVHTLYSGKTVEITNTDAEGRLVLADGVVYAERDLKAQTIVDIATLTGAQGIATGKYHAGIVSTSARLEAAAVAAGLLSGNLAHPLPFAPEMHFAEYNSPVADMTNSVADRSNAQVSCAGLFILAHLGFEFPGDWLHVDMASPSHQGDRATGYGVGLLTVLFGAHTQNKLLQALSPGPVLKQ